MILLFFKNIRLSFAFYWFIVFSICLFSQNNNSVEITINDKTEQISAIQKEAVTYISTKDLASSFNINYFVNAETQKVELKFTNYTLKITARNPFWVLTGKNPINSKTIQVPLSSVLLKNDIFIPLDYSLSVLKTCFGSEIIIKKSSSTDTQKNNNKEIKTDNSSVDSNKKEKDTSHTANSKTLFNINIDEKTNGTLVTIKNARKLGRYTHSLKNHIIKLSFPGKQLTDDNIQDNGLKGLIKSVSTFTNTKAAELHFGLLPNYTTYEVLNTKNDIIITIHNKKFHNNNKNDTKKDKWSFDVVVLDPGHGGKDPGAIGINKVKEKDINLAISKKVGELINKNLKDLKVFYTRDSDKFVELYKRGKIANEKNGKLFISIHCNSMPKKNSSTKGFEVYLLRPGRTDDAIAIAEFENSVIKFEDDQKRYQKLTDENFILVTMAHSSYMRYSEKFAEILDNHIRTGADISSKGVKQAGFYVLVGASMPSVLVEAGFLSNKEDAAYLTSEKGQKEIAEAIFNSIKSFKLYYDSVIENE